MSGGPVRKSDGKSVRAETQVRKWNKEAGYEKYESNITLKEPEGEGARDRIYKYEKKHAEFLHSTGQLMMIISIKDLNSNNNVPKIYID